jgi:DNA-directed RNA polymerase specialized sigma24 family protein
MRQALRAQDAVAIAEVSRRRSRDEQAMAQYLGIGRGARAKGAPLHGTLLRRPDDVDLAAFESEEWRRLEAAIAQLSPDARRELATDRVDGGRR